MLITAKQVYHPHRLEVKDRNLGSFNLDYNNHKNLPNAVWQYIFKSSKQFLAISVRQVK